MAKNETVVALGDKFEMPVLPYFGMDCTCALIQEILGTSASNKNIAEDFQTSKSNDSVKSAEELDALPDEETVEKGMTVFFRDDQDRLCICDYQVRGFLKEAFSVLRLIPGTACFEAAKKTCKGEDKNPFATQYGHKKVVDNDITVYPRFIPIEMPEGGVITTCQRPLRSDDWKAPGGVRVALANSESAPAGSKLRFTIHLQKESLIPLVLEALAYGQRKGFGQWRNSGKGSFTCGVTRSA